MRNKIKLVLTLGVIFISSFLSVEKSGAATCWNGTCKPACSAGTEIVSPVSGDGCSDSGLCCVEKCPSSSLVGCVDNAQCETPTPGGYYCSSTSQTCCDVKTGSGYNFCKDAVNGAECTTTDGQPGFCKSGFCNTSVSDPTDPEDPDSSTSGSGWNSDDLDSFGLPEAGGGDAGDVIMNVLDWLLTIVGIVAIIAFVISGFQYFMVASDEKMMERAKKTMTYAIIGLVVALSGFIVIQAIDSMLNTESFF